MSVLDKIKRFLDWSGSTKPDINLYTEIYDQLRPFRLPLITIVLMMLIGTLGYVFIAGFSLVDAFYQAGMTFTTVGFTEVAPISPAGRIFTVLFILMGFGTFSFCLGVVVEVIKNKLQTLLEHVQPYVRDIVFVPDLIGVPLYNVEAQTLFNEQVMMLSLRNNLARRRNQWFKRVFDVVISGLLCIPILPIILIVALCIKLDSKGGAFFNGQRIGKYGKTFSCYKFRSMYVNASDILEEYLAAHPTAQEEWNTFAKLRDYDPRVTKVGKWIRKYSLDELPQILNVIKGDMSLVGPRPYLPREREDIGEYLSTITLTVPGITGFWQTSGRNNVSFAGRVAMDTWYVRNWSIWLDLMYLFKTAKIVFTGKGAY